MPDKWLEIIGVLVVLIAFLYFIVGVRVGISI